MSYRVSRFGDYEIRCDFCKVEKVIHKNDFIMGEFVNSNNAIRLAGYHTFEDSFEVFILCDNCFAKEKMKKNSKH